MKKLFFLAILICCTVKGFSQYYYNYNPYLNPYNYIQSYNAYMQQAQENYRLAQIRSQQIQEGLRNGTIVVQSNGNTCTHNNSQTTNNTSNTRQNQSQPRLCGQCNGKGWVVDYVAGYGTQKLVWCNQCGKKMMSNHYHKTCPGCKGKGQW